MHSASVVAIGLALVVIAAAAPAAADDDDDADLDAERIDGDDDDGADGDDDDDDEVVRRRVRIVSTPPGAVVYLDDREDGARGETPLDLELEAGRHRVILELAGHASRSRTIQVKARGGKRRQVFSITLSPAAARAMLVVEPGGLPPGARVLVDGVEVGITPLSTEIEPGPHQVQVIATDHEPFEEWIELADGDERMLRPTATARTTPIVRAPVAAPRPPRPRPPLGTASAGIDVGWRRFRYDDPETANLRPFDADGVLLLRLEAELQPWRLSRVFDGLSPLSIVLAGGLSLPLPSQFPDGETVDSYWRMQEVALRWRLAPAARAAVDVEAGWSRLLFTFRGDDALVAQVPDVDYENLRLAARGVLRLGAVEPYLGAEYRVVLAAGVLATRFEAADVTGYAGRVGVLGRWWGNHIATRAELAVARYGWSLEADADAPFVASGGVDTFVSLTFTVGLSY